MKSCSTKQTQHHWPHKSRGEDGDGLGTCAEYHMTYCPRQPYAGQQTVEGDVVARKKHGDEQWEMKECGQTWDTITKQAVDRQQWRSLVEALCATWHEENLMGILV